MPPVPDIDRGPLENHAEPVVSFQAMAVAIVVLRTVFDVEFPATVAAGAQVWLCAFWFNPRSQSGPACQPISAYLAGGVTGSQAQAA